MSSDSEYESQEETGMHSISPLESWKKKLITEREESIICNNQMMFNDSIICYFQKMINSECSSVNGLQDPIRGKAGKFVQCKDPFVQIIHDGDKHWVCISTYGCKPGEVLVVDTLHGGSVSVEVKRQICQIMKYEGQSLKLKFLPVQQQSKVYVNCGAFAIAWARRIAEFKKVDATHNFDETLLRSHLINALQTNTLGNFPSLAQGVFRRCKQRTVRITLLCICRMFWTEEDELMDNK